MKKVDLRVPSLEDMKYRQVWMMNPKTMSYNAGMDLDIPGYDYETGTIKKSDEELVLWYQRWGNNNPDKYVAYIYEENGSIPIGETYFYKSDDTYKMGILIIDEYRGNGLSESALLELIKVAFLEYGIPELTNSFPESRSQASSLFKKCGFVESGKVEESFVFGEKVINKEVILTKENYLRSYNNDRK